MKTDAIFLFWFCVLVCNKCHVFDPCISASKMISMSEMGNKKPNYVDWAASKNKSENFSSS